jgi:hypothetical protein
MWDGWRAQQSRHQRSFTVPAFVLLLHKAKVSIFDFLKQNNSIEQKLFGRESDCVIFNV